jgi:hypothetical protein
LWYQNGKWHRDGDKPAMEKADCKLWFQQGELHRDEDKPAIEYTNGSKYWYQHGKLHRDGNKPAVLEANGNVEYWINGEKVWVSRQKSPEMVETECVITYEVIQQDTDCGFCLICKKAMCYNALREWLRENDSCPHCRSEWTNFVVYK